MGSLHSVFDSGRDDTMTAGLSYTGSNVPAGRDLMNISVFFLFSALYNTLILLYYPFVFTKHERRAIHEPT